MQRGNPESTMEVWTFLDLTTARLHCEAPLAAPSFLDHVLCFGGSSFCPVTAAATPSAKVFSMSSIDVDAP